MRMQMKVLLLMVSTVLILGAGAAVHAHKGHDHTVMGTVTTAAAGHIMLKDRDGKDVAVQVSKTTRVKASPPMTVADIRPGTRVVVTGPMEKDQITAKVIEVGVAGAGK
jgi:hypothetical protein